MTLVMPQPVIVTKSPIMIFKVNFCDILETICKELNNISNFSFTPGDICKICFINYTVRLWVLNFQDAEYIKNLPNLIDFAHLIVPKLCNSVSVWIVVLLVINLSQQSRRSLFCVCYIAYMRLQLTN